MPETKAQTDARLAWLYTTIYWFIGHLLGLHRGYYSQFHKSFTSFCQRPNLFQWTALLITVVCQHRINPRYSNFGRHRHVWVVLIFGLANGLWETFWFLAAHDFGKWCWPQHAPTAGFMMYSMFTALIHVWFWLPLVFPPHTRADAVSFHRRGLPELTILSLAWIFLLYERSGDVFGVCVLHALIDVWATWNMGLQGPFSSEAVKKRRH